MRNRNGSTLTRPAFRPSVASPRSDVFAPPPPERQLPVHRVAVAAGYLPGWLFVAAHGGSGSALLSRLSWQDYERAALSANADRRPIGDYQPYGIAVGRAWPDPALESSGLVIVVCRTTMQGLARARDAAVQYLSGHIPPGLRLVGVVTIADQPGRLPQPISAAKGLLSGAYPHAWHVPYVAEYRLHTGLPDEPCPPIHPAVADVLASIRATVTPKGLCS